MTLEQVAREWGLPLAMLVAFAWAILKRRLVTGGELADKQDELDKMTALYERERADRMAAEQGLVKSSSASVEVAEAVRDALAELARRDPYTERLEGSPRRGR